MARIPRQRYLVEQAGWMDSTATKFHPNPARPALHRTDSRRAAHTARAGIPLSNVA